MPVRSNHGWQKRWTKNILVHQDIKSEMEFLNSSQNRTTQKIKGNSGKTRQNKAKAQPEREEATSNARAQHDNQSDDHTASRPRQTGTRPKHTHTHGSKRQERKRTAQSSNKPQTTRTPHRRSPTQPPRNAPGQPARKPSSQQPQRTLRAPKLEFQKNVFERSGAKPITHRLQIARARTPGATVCRLLTTGFGDSSGTCVDATRKAAPRLPRVGSLSEVKLLATGPLDCTGRLLSLLALHRPKVQPSASCTPLEWMLFASAS